jgi:hypothetical protein
MFSIPESDQESITAGYCDFLIIIEYRASHMEMERFCGIEMPLFFSRPLRGLESCAPPTRR